MRKIHVMLAILVIALNFVACQKAELVPPAEDVALEAKRGGSTTLAAAVTYTGQATSVNATIWNFQNTYVTSNQTILAQTINLPSTGGSDDTTQYQASIQGALTAGSLYAYTVGNGDSTRSKSTAENLSITVGGHTITAKYAHATALAKCGTAVSGSAKFDSLVVNGTAIAVTGAPNQMVYLATGGYLIINEQSTSKKTGVFNVAALHIIIPNKADITVASAKVGIKC